MPFCPNCGQENPEGFRLCGMCGTPLAAGVAPGGEERKVVTVLFCDLVGFTAASDRADPEDVKARLRPYHARVRQEIERYGGTVEKFVGDAVMAVCGAPVAHEDDAERGVRAGLAILEAIAELNEADPDLALQVRVGINTGEAVVALGAHPERGEGIVTGDVVNTAARIQTAAPVNGVAVGEQTYRATSRIFDYEPLPPVGVKGKSQPLSLWRAKAARARYGSDVRRQFKTPFVGRELEKPLLIATFERATQQRSVQLITIVGEPGVGKSRLIAELLAYTHAKPEITRWKQGRCLPYGEGITFWALGEIVKAEAGILESDSPQLATEKLEAIVSPEEPDRQWLLQRLAPLVGVEAASAAERQELFTAWRRFLESLAAMHPSVLVFEDLHWADEALLAFLEYLAEWSQDVPLLVLCAARPELYERRPGWGAGQRNAQTINLSPLSDQETAELVSYLTKSVVLSRELERAVLERASGNPLYAEEFARLFADRGLDPQADAFDEAGLPDSVQALIASRLDTLPSERKSLLQDGAVVGKVFWAGALAEISGHAKAEVEVALHELARKELVRPARTSSMEGETEYSFWHLLVRDVAYSQIPRAERARRHRAAAAWIERKAGERVEDLAEVLAHHYSQALELVRASGAADAKEVGEAAQKFLVLAGDRAMQLDVGKAESYYRQALQLVPPGDEGRAAVLAKAAESASVSGRFSDAEKDYRDAVDALRVQGDRLGAADAMVGLAMVLWLWGKTAQSRELMGDVVETLEGEPPGPELAHAYTDIARDRWLSGLAGEALEWSSKALPLAEEFRLHEVAVRSRQVRGGARCLLGDLGGLNDLRQALQTSLEHGLGVETVRGHINLGEWIWYTEGPARGLEVMRAGIDFGERRGITSLTMPAKGHTLWVLFDLGQWDELLRVADETIAADRQSGGSYYGVMALSYRGQVLALRGRLDEAKQLEVEFLPRAREIGDAQILFPALAIGAQIDLALGDEAATLELVEEFDHVRRRSPHFGTLQMHLVARVCNGLKAVELGRRLLEGCSPIATRHRCCLLTAEATLAEAEERFDQGVERYTEAAERWREFGHVFEHGLALLGTGRCLLSLGRAGEARSAFSSAKEIFARLGAQPLVAESDALLERTAALTP